MVARNLVALGFIGAVLAALATPVTAQEPEEGGTQGAEWPLRAEDPRRDTGGALPTRESWREFFRQRTRWGVGFDESYHHNLFATRGASRREDFETTLEAQIAFADPRGDWLYGASYEVNAFRHHNVDQNGIHHEWRTYAHYTPLTRYRLALTEEFRIDDRLIAEISQSDEIRRFTNVTRSLHNQLGLSATYDLNQTNAAKLTYDWDVLDDQATDDANVDHWAHEIVLGVDHDLARRWTLFGGYVFEDLSFPRAPAKDSQRHGIELGSKYAVDPLTNAELTLDWTQRSIAAGDSSLEFDLKLEVTRLVSPRTRWALTIDRKNLPSVSGAAQAFETDSFSFALSHELTQTITARWAGRYEHVETKTKRSDRWGAGWDLAWRWRPNVSCTARYEYQLLSQSDIVTHDVTVGCEAQLW